MKRIAIALATLFVLSPLFADDAITLPAGVIRITTAASYVTADKGYDKDSKEVDLAKKKTFLNVGGALEFGLTDWISGAIQWAPGYNVWSEIGDTKEKFIGFSDIFAGAKIQIVGSKAPVAMEGFRFAVAPGIKIPLPGPDFEQEAKNKADGKEYIAEITDKHALGIGGRVYADAVLTDAFFINLHGEFIYYPMAVPFEKMSLEAYTASAMAKAFGMTPPKDVNFGWDLKVEADPHFEAMVADGLKLSASLPVTYTMSPAVKIDDKEQANMDRNKLQIGPNAAVFFLKSPLPFELKAAYMLPLMGKNETKFGVVSLQAKIFLKF